MLVDLVSRDFGLGGVARVTELHGGVNRVWRAGTGAGTFAVHELLGLVGEADVLGRCQRIFDLEVAAAANGVRLARPVPATDGAAAAILGGRGPVTVHEWVDAPGAARGTADPSFYASLGRSLARIHALALEPPPLETLSTTDLHLAAALDDVARWGAAVAEPRIFSHRDLTPDNTLDAGGEAVLIDWESAGAVHRGTEIGRTALDHLGDGHRITSPHLRTFLAAYAEVLPLPPVGLDWCSLWIWAMVAFAVECERSVTEGTAPASLLAFQASIVEMAPAETARRVAAAPAIVEDFAGAALGL